MNVIQFKYDQHLKKTCLSKLDRWHLFNLQNLTVIAGAYEYVYRHRNHNKF